MLRGSVRAPSGFSLDKPSAAKPRGLRFLGFAALGLPLENHSILGKNELNSYQLAPCIPLQKYWPGPAQTQSLALLLQKVAVEEALKKLMVLMVVQVAGQEI